MQCPLCQARMQEITGSVMPPMLYLRCVGNKCHWITHGEFLQLQEGIRGKEIIESMRRRDQDRLSVHSFRE